MYTPLFNELIHNALMKRNPSLNLVLLQLWQKKIALNIYRNVASKVMF